MRYIASCLVMALLFATGCGRAPQRANEVVAVAVPKLALDPEDSAWRQAPEYAAKLLPQDLVEPRLLKPSTAEVLVRSLTSGTDIAFRLEWIDAARNDLPGPGRFLDGCAIQIPAKADPELPDPQMGQAGKPVEITFWRADWQASVNGRPDDIHSLYPNASIDHYPFEARSLEVGSDAQKEMAKRYAPAAAVGNRRVGPRETPVEDMIAEGPGTLSPAPRTASRGKGLYGKQGWSVVMIRPLPTGLTPKTRTTIAFAVWDGSHEEAGARKMRSGWVPLAIREDK
jgi:ethylbenzene dehydrogenase